MKTIHKRATAAAASLVVVASALPISGCGMTPAAQVASVQTCIKAGLDYEIGKNDLGRVVVVNCVKPKPVVKE